MNDSKLTLLLPILYEFFFLEVGTVEDLSGGEIEVKGYDKEECMCCECHIYLPSIHPVDPRYEGNSDNESKSLTKSKDIPSNRALTHRKGYI